LTTSVKPDHDIGPAAVGGSGGGGRELRIVEIRQLHAPGMPIRLCLGDARSSNAHSDVNFLRPSPGKNGIFPASWAQVETLKLP